MGRPLRIMFHNPVGNDAYDGMFADVLGRYRLPGTELHVTSLPPEEGAFRHIEYRAYEGRVTGGIVRASRAAAREGFLFKRGAYQFASLAHDAKIADAVERALPGIMRALVPGPRRTEG